MPQKLATLETARLFREKAAAMQKAIDKKMNPATAAQNPTPRRARIIAGMFEDGVRLAKVQRGMLGMADAIETKEIPPTLRYVVTPFQVAAILLSSEFDRDDKIYEQMFYADIWTDDRFDNAKEELSQLIDDTAIQAARRALELKQRGQALIGQVPGYFPTPAKVVARMLPHIKLGAGETVFDPAAGGGAILDAVKEIHPDLALETVGIEINHALWELAISKGHNVTHASMFDVPTATKYDNIIMNPPFERDQTAQFIQYAFEHFLADNGTLISVIDGGVLHGSSKSDLAFQRFVADNGFAYDLPKNSFKESMTGVATEFVVLTK